MIADHLGGDVDGHRGSILLARALPSDAEQLSCRSDAGDVLRPDRSPASQSPSAARAGAPRAARRIGRLVLRRASDRSLLRAARRAAAAGARAVLAGVDQ